MKMKIKLKAGQQVRAVGRDTRGHTVIREGYLVADPELRYAAWDGPRRKVFRLHVDADPSAEPSRQNWVSVLSDADVNLLADQEGPIALVGLAGLAGSGKDTAAKALVEIGWQRRAFADKVKDFLYAVNPWTVDDEINGSFPLADEVDRYGWSYAKSAHPEVRAYLQRCGTEAGRNVLGANVWVDALFGDAATWGPTVITDVRFPNEAAEIVRRGGRVINIVRPGQQLIAPSDHVSESALVDWPFEEVLINDGTAAELGAHLRLLVQRM
ncbi:deoxynucleotide monophosphate kinase family protein [Streptomyces vinaceus]|uniref:deoxynucleotide monophosphate kinase family protein n=1 Tax=Streptomyces vinaceus TaxID=1960 RepID=UPI00380E8FFA